MPPKNRDGYKGYGDTTVDCVHGSKFLHVDNSCTRTFQIYNGGRYIHRLSYDPVHKSVRANPLKMMGKGVREKFFFQIAVKIRRFSRTAITDNTAMSVDIVISRWHEAKDRL